MWSLNLIAFVNCSLDRRSLHNSALSGINSCLQTPDNADCDQLMRELEKDFVLDRIGPTELSRSEAQVSLLYFSKLPKHSVARINESIAEIKSTDSNRSFIAVLDPEFGLSSEEIPHDAMTEFDDIIISSDNYLNLRKRILSFCHEQDEQEAVIDDQQQAICQRHHFVGQSQAYFRLFTGMERYAQCDASLMISGETGVGKEVAARVVHGLSGRSDEQFLALNCAMISDDEFYALLRDTLAKSQSDDSFKVTIFLDEVDGLSLEAQKILLQFLNRQEYNMETVIGENKANARFISATTKDLMQCAKKGKFREELIYRLTTLTLDVPPLRQRVSDIEVIARNLIRRFADKYQLGGKSISAESILWLQQQAWSGNVRELENVLLNAYLTSEGDLIQFHDSQALNQADVESATQKISCNAFYDDDIGDLSYQQAKEQVLRQFSSTYLASQLAKTAGNVSRAAKLSGKERRAFGKLLKKYNVDKSEYFADAC